MARMDNWLLWALASAVFAALTAILGKAGVETVSSDYAVLVRTVVILIVVFAIVLLTGQFRSQGTVSVSSYAFLTLSGLATGVSWLCYYRALKLGTASQVAPIDKLSVLLVAVFGVAFLGEKLSLKNWGGVALIAVGVILASARTKA